jgi:hypothetical protein
MRKPTRIKIPQANAICEHIHQVTRIMMSTSEIDMAPSVEPADIDIFTDNAAWAICSTYHTILKVSSGKAIFGQDMVFHIPVVADWKQIGDYRQCQIDCSNACVNSTHADFDYKDGDNALIKKMLSSTSRVHVGKTTMDCFDSSYKWNWKTVR